MAELTKIVFQNGAEGNTPISNTNLNQMQANTETFGKAIEKEIGENITKEQKRIAALEQENAEQQNKINAIMQDYETKEIQGSSIHINDSLEYDMPISINGGIEQDSRVGYNLLENKLTTKTNGGVTFTKNTDGSVSYDGTSTGSYSLCYADLNTENIFEEGKTYYINANGTNNEVGLYVIYKTSGEYIGAPLAKGSNEVKWVVPSGITQVFIRAVVFSNGVNVTGQKICPQITTESGKPYEQFGAMPSLAFPSEVKGVSGHYDTVVENKNLLENNLTSKTINGLDVVVNNDKTIIINGTATATTVLNLINDEIGTNASERILKKGTYTLSGCPSGGSGSTNYKLDINTPTAPFMTDIGNKITSTFEEDKTYTGIRIVIYSGCVCNNLTFKPMLEKGKVATDYTPHQEQLLPIDIPFNMYSGKPYKENGKWYRDVEWQKLIFDGTILNFPSKSGTTANNYFYSKVIENILVPSDNNKEVKLYSNCFKSTYVNNIYSKDIKGIGISNAGQVGFGFGLDSEITTIELANAWLQEQYANGTPLYAIVPLKKPYAEEITDTTLIEQLEELQKAHSYYEVTNINSYGSEDAADLVLSGEYVRSNKIRIENLEKALLSLSADV